MITCSRLIWLDVFISAQVMVIWSRSSPKTSHSWLRLICFLVWTATFAVFAAFYILAMQDNQDYFFDNRFARRSSARPSNPTGGILDISGIPSDIMGPKLIVDWTGEFGHFASKEVTLLDCPSGLTCRLTSNRSFSEEADAIFFHIRNFDWDNIPPVRHPWQRYVFVLLESPMHTGVIDLNKIPRFFNWTLTYRQDSDIFNPYGLFWHKNLDLPLRNYTLDWDQIWTDMNDLNLAIAAKKFPIVGFVSNCHTSSHRELYVKQLQKYIPVHIYGNCGWGNCSTSQRDLCNQLMEKQYWFYLALENSICKDYVTEKLFSRLRYWSVPIVIKRELVENYQQIPGNSFIALDDFKSAKELSDHLHMLMNNVAKYKEYFNWKLQYDLILDEAGSFNESSYRAQKGNKFCALCQKLDDSPLTSKSYDDMNRWWTGEGNCEQGLISKLL